MGTGQIAFQKTIQTILDQSKGNGLPLQGIGGVLVKIVNGVAFSVPAVAGFCIKGQPDQIQINDVFRIDSCTKPHTGYLMACLFQERPDLFPDGWQTTIGNMFPELNDPSCQARYGITTDYLNAQVQDLMSHTSRLSYQPNLGYEALVGVQNEVLPAYHDEYCNAASELHRRYLYVVTAQQDQPVAIGTYSGGGIICAAMAERQFPGQRWEELMWEYVFSQIDSAAQLGNKTCTNGPPFNSLTNPVDGVWGHSQDGNHDPNSNSLALNFDGHAPVGGISCSMGDLGLFLLANLGWAPVIILAHFIHKRMRFTPPREAPSDCVCVPAGL